MTATLRSILISPERPRTPGKRTVNFHAQAIIIGGQEVPLAAPAVVDDELTFDYNPPASSSSTASGKGGSGKGGRAGTIRIKGGMKNFSAMEEMAREEEAQQRRAQAIFSGHLKHLKESGMKATWSKRYVVLTKDSLAFHRKADDAKPVKTFELNGDCYVREISQRPGVTDCQNAMEIFFSRSKSAVFKGASQRETTEWITAICSVIDTFAGSEDDDMEFVDEDEFEFIDEEEEAQATPPKEIEREKEVSKPASPVINLSADHVAESSGLDDPSEDSDDSFEWVDEDDHKPKEEKKTAPTAKKVEASASPGGTPKPTGAPAGARNAAGQKPASGQPRGQRPLQARQVAGQLRGRPPTPYAGRAPRGRGNPAGTRPSGLAQASRGGAAPAKSANAKSATNASSPAPASTPAKSANRVGNLLAMFEAPK